MNEKSLFTSKNLSNYNAQGAQSHPRWQYSQPFECLLLHGLKWYCHQGNILWVINSMVIKNLSNCIAQAGDDWKVTLGEFRHVRAGVAVEGASCLNILVKKFDWLCHAPYLLHIGPQSWELFFIQIPPFKELHIGFEEEAESIRRRQ